MEADAVLFVPVVKQRKLSFCCVVYGIVSENASICLSVFVMADQRMLWLTSFVLFVVLMLSQSTILVMLGAITKQVLKCLVQKHNTTTL